MKLGWRFSWLDNFLHINVICHHKPPVGGFVHKNLGKAYKTAGHNITFCKETKKDL